MCKGTTITVLRSGPLRGPRHHPAARAPAHRLRLPLHAGAGRGAGRPAAEPADRWRLVRSPGRLSRQPRRHQYRRGDRRERSSSKESGGNTIADLTGIGLGPDPTGLQAHRRERPASTSSPPPASMSIPRSPTGCARRPSSSSPAAWSTTSPPAAPAASAAAPSARSRWRRAPSSSSSASAPAPRARAHRRARASSTSCPASCHPSGRSPTRSSRSTRPRAANSTRLVLCHQDGSGDDPAYQERLLKMGLWVEYDTFGSEGVFAFGADYIQLPTDTQRIRELAVLVRMGFLGNS